MYSPAFENLSAQQRAVWLYVASRYNGFNNGSIAVSVREVAKHCRLNKDTAGRCLLALQRCGFIEAVVEGGFSYKLRHATEYRLTHLQCNRTKALPTKEFMRWPSPVADLSKSRPPKVGKSCPFKSDDVASKQDLGPSKSDA
jgi:hypothetical protein